MISNNVYYISGRKKFEAKDFQGALHDYNEAIKMEENPAIYSERAVVYFYLKQLDKSLADMDYAAELEPENPYRYSSRAYIKDAMGDTEGAIRDYEQAVKLDPEDSIAHNNLGLLQEKLGYKDQAKLSFNRADTLEQVDDLLDNIRKEQGWINPTDNSEVANKRVPSTNKMSIPELIKHTFTTRKGFREYMAFIRNGFKF